MLIDGGYAETYQSYIRTNLVDFAANGYQLDLVVATHVDADHISGLLTFFRQNGYFEKPKIIPVHEVLHNSLRSLVLPSQGQTTLRPDDAALLQEIRQRGYPLPTAPVNLEQEISARQGNSLTQLLRDGGYRWNTHDGTLSVGGDGLRELRMPNALIKVLCPSQTRLDALKKWWVSEIRRLGLVGSLAELDDIFEFLCAHEVVDPGAQMLASAEADLAKAHLPDDSVTNGSSISLLLKVENCQLLFLGDAWADEIVAALKQEGTTIFDAIKVSHHGSARNTSAELLSLVDSPHYFISTNGEEHEHPDFAVLKAIVDRPTTFRRTLHFNYATASSRRLKAYSGKAGTDFAVMEGQTEWVALGGQTTP